MNPLSSPFSSRCLAAVCAPLAACALSSCYEIRSDTVLRSDGSVERAVDQPWDHTPADVAAAPVWMVAHFHDGSGFEKLDLPLAEAKAEGGEEAPSRFTAWAKFASVDELPDHHVLKTADGTREVRLLRRHETRDHGLVQEFLWEETATEIVTVGDMEEAQREYAENWRRVLLAFLEEALGPDYDLSGADAWLKDSGMAWHEAYVDFEFDRMARSARRVLALDFGDDEAHAKALAELCAGYGLKLTDEKGEPLDSGAEEEAMVAFLLETLTDTLRTKDGGSVPPEVIEGFLAQLVDDGSGEVAEEDAGGEGEGAEEEDPIQSAWERAVERVLGEEGLDEAGHKTLEQRLNGLQGGSFKFTMTVPGSVVATSGTLLGDGRVRWKFGGSRAFPSGYPMAVRSLESDPALQEKLLGSAPLADRASLLRYVELASGDERLAEALRACVAESGTAPLDALRENIAAAEDEDERESRGELLDQMEKLLGVE